MKVLLNHLQVNQHHLLQHPHPPLNSHPLALGYQFPQALQDQMMVYLGHHRNLRDTEALDSLKNIRMGLKGKAQ